MSFYQCFYCEQSYRSNNEREDHEEICAKNDKTEAERFEVRKHLAERHNEK